MEGWGGQMEKDCDIDESLEQPDEREAVPTINTGGTLPQRPAYWTFDRQAWAYYFAPTERAKGPYRRQLEVKAIVDVAEDGTIGDVELVWGQLPPPPKGTE